MKLVEAVEEAPVEEEEEEPEAEGEEAEPSSPRGNDTGDRASS